MDWKKHFFYVSPKTSFLEPNLIQKPSKNQNLHKKNYGVIFIYKNLTYWFLRAQCEISAHTDGPNFFSILNCLFAKNLNPVLRCWWFFVLPITKFTTHWFISLTQRNLYNLYNLYNVYNCRHIFKIFNLIWLTFYNLFHVLSLSKPNWF